jgi:5-hydroxyisourate hydrolase
LPAIASLAKALMGQLTTHVLDTMNGCPAAGMAVRLYRLVGDAPVLLESLRLNADGRADAPLLSGADFNTGRYRLQFDVAGYFTARGVVLPEPPFLDQVALEFGVADATGHYHVPLLASPWAYSTYRGS